MLQSNSYIIGFSIALTVIMGALLSLASVGLKEKQDVSKAFDTKTQILSAVMSLEGKTTEAVTAVYEKQIKGMVINSDAKMVTNDREGAAIANPDVFALKVEIGKEFKLPVEQRMLPVFKFMSATEADKVDAYIIPLFGNGLWDNIWGYLAVEMNTETGKWDKIRGVSFGHKGETPGLGARITTLEVQDRFKGKSMYDASGAFAVRMLKGENGVGVKEHPNNVDGMSGATITANGVNDMMKAYVGYYKTFFDGLSKPVEVPATPVQADTTQKTSASARWMFVADPC